MFSADASTLVYSRQRPLQATMSAYQEEQHSLIVEWLRGRAERPQTTRLIAVLSHLINRAIVTIAHATVKSDQRLAAQFRREAQRFFLWADGLDARDGSLEESLEQSMELKHCVQDLLVSLGATVLAGLDWIFHETEDSVPDHGQQAQKLLFEAILPFENVRSNILDVTMRHKSTEQTDLNKILASITVYIDCLLDLVSVVEDPATDFGHDTKHEAPAIYPQLESFVVSSDEALVYCRRIRDRFRTAPKFLVERLAQANATRAAMLRDLEQAASVDNGKGRGGAMTARTESIFTSKGPSSMTTSRPTKQSSIFSKSKRQGKDRAQPQVPSSQSEVTFATFTTATSLQLSSRPRVPPIPQMTEHGSLKCSFCILPLSASLTRKQWK